MISNLSAADDDRPSLGHRAKKGALPREGGVKKKE